MTDKEQTKELPVHPPKPPSITSPGGTDKVLWKAVQPRHYVRAQERKRESKEAYVDYVVSLVERFDDRLVAVAKPSFTQMPIGAVVLNAGEIKQVVAAFEEKFGGEA